MFPRLQRRSESPRRQVALPWERRAGQLRALLLRRGQWRVLLWAGLALWLAAGLWRHGERKRHLRQTRLAITALEQAASAFFHDFGRFPRSQMELLHPTKGKAPYLDRRPRDAWGRALALHCPDPAEPTRCQALSAGPSGFFVYDDNIH
ncbi:MAG: type II secretion system protein GspG [Polyangiales bacterium]